MHWILKRACFDCHSNETRYPWYSYLPGASLVLAEHVRDGKMPTWDYQMLHSEAKLSAADVAIIKNASR